MTREELYRAFGPKLIEAIVRITLEEINKLRAVNGLSEYSNEQLITAISNELKEIPDYSWMENI